MLQVNRVLKGENLYSEQLPVNVNRSEENFYLEQHKHDFIEIIYVENGAGFHYIEDELVRVRRGDVFYLPVGTSHVFRPTGQSPTSQLIIYNCVIKPSFLKSLQDIHELELPFFPLANALQVDHQDRIWFTFRDQGEEIGAIFRNMFAEYVVQGPGCRTVLTAWLLLLHVKLFQRDNGDPSPHNKTGNQMQAALEWLEQNFNEAVTLEKAAAIANMSPRHFYRLFKRQTGQTFLEYVQNKRIIQSCMLLESTDLNVSEIAYEAGYKDLKSFYRVFKRLVGTTPNEYRRQQMNNRAVDV
ncbi:MAG: helix-turn-helix transcriptional regulator [Gorillibacterium sp.]|nr:helix-turn-helix transcriptional regulator [Gorillibacterium sp.]